MNNLYFDPVEHKYTDDVKTRYTSVTTLIGKYETKFSDKEKDIAKACERIGRNKRHPKYLKYKGKSATQILAEWKKEGDVAREHGNNTHDYLEKSVNESNGYGIFKKRLTGGRIYTISDILNNSNYGRVNLDLFREHKIDILYPRIYTLIELFVKDGWKIYAEVGVHSPTFFVSGIDILAVKDDKFFIIDWKTNKHELRYDSGYWDRDHNKNILGFIKTNDFFKYPLNELMASVGNKYTLQLSLYAFLVEQYGLKWAGSYLCHIRHHNYVKSDKILTKYPELLGKTVVDLYNIKYIKTDVINMLNDNLMLLNS